MYLIGAIDGTVNRMKLVTKCLEVMGIHRDRPSAALHHLKIIFEVDFASLGAVAESVFQGEPDLLRGRSTASAIASSVMEERRRLSSLWSVVFHARYLVFGVCEVGGSNRGGDSTVPSTWASNS